LHSCSARRAVRLGRGVDQEAAITPIDLAGVLPIEVGRDAPVAPSIPIPNPIGGVGSWVGGKVVDAVKALLRALSDDFLKQLADPVVRYVLHTPDLLVEATLRSYWLVSLSALFACAGLLVAIAGVAVIPGNTNRLSMAAREAISIRLPGCLLTAAISLPLVALEVALANRLVDAFVGAGFGSGNNPLWNALTQAVHGDAGAGLALLVTTTVGVVLLIALVVVGLIRWATLWLLVVLAPVAMGFALLPSGAGVARLWWRLQLATVFLPVANAVLVGTYVAMFTSERTGLTGALAGVAVLALMTKLPGWVAGVAVGVEAAEVSHRLRRASRTTRHVATSAVGVVTPTPPANAQARYSATKRTPSAQGGSTASRRTATPRGTPRATPSQEKPREPPLRPR
jgi:hypothetical protein